MLVKDKVHNTTGTFDTEIISMSLTGNTPSGPIIVRESPYIPSAGQTTITDVGGGLYHIDSFFDVFTELSIDGGASWVACDAGTRMFLTDHEPRLGTIIVEKQTIPDGENQSFDFTGTPSGSIKDGEQIVVSGLTPGTYSSTEGVPSNWELSSIVCDDSNSTGDTTTATATFQLEAGETITCIFTNEKLETPCFIRYYPVGSPQYNLWVSLGKPDCWCSDIHQCGDVNGDCSISIADDIMPMIIAREGWPETYSPCADVDYDGYIGIANDIMTAVNHRAGLAGHVINGEDCLDGTCTTAVGQETDRICDPEKDGDGEWIIDGNDD